MWKIFAGFVVFAALAIFVLLKGGDKVDMQGEAGMHQANDSPASSSAAAPVAASASAAASTSASVAAPAPAAAVSTSSASK